MKHQLGKVISPRPPGSTGWRTLSLVTLWTVYWTPSLPCLRRFKFPTTPRTKCKVTTRHTRFCKVYPCLPRPIHQPPPLCHLGVFFPQVLLLRLEALWGVPSIPGALAALSIGSTNAASCSLSPPTFIQWGIAPQVSLAHLSHCVITHLSSHWPTCCCLFSPVDSGI